MDTLKIAAGLVLAALGGGAVAWLVMVLQRQAERIAELSQRSQQRELRDHADTQRLSDQQAEIARLRAANEDLQRRSWPGSLNLDQRAWLASISGLQEVAAQDQLDALMRLSPEAVKRVVERIAPHLFTRESIK